MHVFLESNSTLIIIISSANLWNATFIRIVFESVGFTYAPSFLPRYRCDNILSVNWYRVVIQ